VDAIAEWDVVFEYEDVVKSVRMKCGCPTCEYLNSDEGCCKGMEQILRDARSSQRVPVLM